MKNLFLLFIIAFANSYGLAQDIPAKANTITITLPDSNNVSDKLVDVLTKKDFIIKSADKSGVSTTAKTLKNSSRISLDAKIKGTDIVLKGMILIASQSSMPIEYKGAKGTPIMNAWEEMDKVAKALGGKVKYEVK
jgi:hypothetical protein